jgi:hypothetical protein
LIVATWLIIHSAYSLASMFMQPVAVPWWKWALPVFVISDTIWLWRGQSFARYALAILSLCRAATLLIILLSIAAGMLSITPLDKIGGFFVIAAMVFPPLLIPVVIDLWIGLSLIYSQALLAFFFHQQFAETLAAFRRLSKESVDSSYDANSGL